MSRRLPSPGVAPENSSTAPATNTAIAMAWGVTATRKVRPSCTRRTAGPRCAHTSCAPSSASAAAKGAIGEQRTQQPVLGHGLQQRQQDRLEHADTAWNVADHPGGDGDQVDAGEGGEAD